MILRRIAVGLPLLLLACSKETSTSVPTIASIEIEKPAANPLVGTTLQLNAVVLNSNGSIVTDREITWSSANATVAAVSKQGLVTAARTGATTIAATVDGKSDTISIQVLPQPVARVELS